MAYAATSDRDLYAILGIASTADQSAITRSYRRLCRLHHPDVSRGPDAERRIREINAAYEILGDARRRLQYDRARAPRVVSSQAWVQARRVWQQSARPPGEPSRPPRPPAEARVRVTPGAIDFGFIGQGEIATRTILIAGRGGSLAGARVLTRGDWLTVDRALLDGDEATVTVTADPRDLHGFWVTGRQETGRLDGYLEVVDAHGSTRVPAGAILRRDFRSASWWNPFARRVS